MQKLRNSGNLPEAEASFHVAKDGLWTSAHGVVSKKAAQIERRLVRKVSRDVDMCASDIKWAL